MKTFKPERYWVVLAVLCLAGCSDDTPLTFGCPGNDLRNESGKCGCDWPHSEKDDDKYWDESENRCIEPTSVCPGNVAAIDTDGDGTPDCLEDHGCDNNPRRIHAGDCGCDWHYPEEFDDHDYDNDGVLDCRDNKHNDNDGGKTEPGVCGFGMKDTDTDEDSTPDCVDKCPDDPNKIDPGVCGCHEIDSDSDGDGTPDCIDLCPDDPDKIDPGICGCGKPDIDDDHDDAIFCADGDSNNQDVCPDNPYRSTDADIAKCPCSWMHPTEFDDHDYDNKGKLDCKDDLDRTKDDTKTEPGVCGFGIPDLDTDGDGIKDCLDTYPYSPCTNISDFNPTSGLYCIKTAADFLKLHEDDINLNNAKIHILNNINLGMLSEFMVKKPNRPRPGEDPVPSEYLSYNCGFKFSKPKDPSNPESEKILPNSFLRSLMDAEFISADDQVKTIALENTYRKARPPLLDRPITQRCHLPYPLFDEISNSKVERIKISLDIEENTIEPSKARASLARRTANANLENVIFDGIVKTTSDIQDFSVGGLVADAVRSTFKNVRCQSATIHAPNAAYVGGIIGKTQYDSNNAQSNIYHTSLDNKHTVSSITGKKYVGGVVGHLAYGSSVRNMAVSINTLTTTDSEAYGGAIIGLATENNSIKNIDLKFDKIEGSNVGGLIGYSEKAPEIKNIISIGASLSGKTVGGLMSVLPESIELQNIYTDVQKISGTTAAGGLFGSAKAGFDLNLVSNRVALLDGSANVGAIVGNMTISSPHTWTNITSIAKVTSTNTQKGGLILNEVVMTHNAKLTFQNTVIGGISNNKSYPLMAVESVAEAPCGEDNTCFDGTNAYYFYKTKPTGNLDHNAALDSIFTPVNAIVKGDNDKISMITSIIEILNGAFPMDSSWKTEGVTLADETDEFMFPIFRDYIVYVKDTFETPEDESGEE